MIIAMTFVMFSAQSQAQEKVSLNYKFEKGKTYTFTQDNIIETTQEMGGQEMKFNTDGKSVLKYEVEDLLTEGRISLVWYYSEYVMHAKGMGRDTTMNMTNMMGKKTRAEISRYGKILKESSTDTSGGTKRGMSMNLSGSSNLIVLPEQSVSPGEKWPIISSDTNTSEEGQIIYKKNIEYIFASKEKKGNHDCVVLTFKGTIELTGKMKQMGMDMAMEGSGDTSGSVWFDPAMGVVVEEQTLTNMEMTMALTGQAQMTIPMTQKISSTQKLAE